MPMCGKDVNFTPVDLVTELKHKRDVRKPQIGQARFRLRTQQSIDGVNAIDLLGIGGDRISNRPAAKIPTLVNLMHAHIKNLENGPPCGRPESSLVRDAVPARHDGLPILAAAHDGW